MGNDTMQSLSRSAGCQAARLPAARKARLQAKRRVAQLVSHRQAPASLHVHVEEPEWVKAHSTPCVPRLPCSNNQQHQQTLRKYTSGNPPTSPIHVSSSACVSSTSNRLPRSKCLHKHCHCHGRYRLHLPKQELPGYPDHVGAYSQCISRYFLFTE